MIHLLRGLFSRFFSHPPAGAHAALQALSDAEIRTVAGGPVIDNRGGG